MKIPRKRLPHSHNGPTSQCPLPTAWSKPPPSLTGCPPQLPDGSLSRAPTQLHEASMETIRSQSRILCAALWMPSPLPSASALSSQHPQVQPALPGLRHLSPLLLTGKTSFRYPMPCTASPQNLNSQLIPSLCVPRVPAHWVSLHPLGTHHFPSDCLPSCLFPSTRTFLELHLLLHSILGWCLTVNFERSKPQPDSFTELID